MTRLTLSSTRLALLCALALTNLACDDAASVSGGQPTAWDTYVVGLEKEGEKGEFKVRLLQSDPIPQDTGFYDWTVEVLTPDGAPVAGAIVLAKPTMPAHGHGTFPPQKTDPVGTTGTYNALRGGSYGDVIEKYMKASNRNYHDQSKRSGGVGIRIVRTK